MRKSSMDLINAIVADFSNGKIDYQEMWYRIDEILDKITTEELAVENDDPPSGCILYAI